LSNRLPPPLLSPNNTIPCFPPTTPAWSARDDADLAEDDMGPMQLTNAARVYNSLLSSVGYLRISSPREREREIFFEKAFSCEHD
jgi:hypothetical protein